jgi:hypothetical protein
MFREFPKRRNDLPGKLALVVPVLVSRPKHALVQEQRSVLGSGNTMSVTLSPHQTVRSRS